MFRRILVAVDRSEAARSAFVFVTDWARQFDAEVWFIVLAEESARPHCQLVTDVGQRGRQRANSFVVRGATRSARNQQLVSAIADAAKTFRADLIVLGFDPRRVARHRFSRGVGEKLTAATETPVLVAPRRCASSRGAVRTADARPQFQFQQPIPLGPVPTPVTPAATSRAAPSRYARV